MINSNRLTGAINNVRTRKMRSFEPDNPTYTVYVLNKQKTGGKMHN